MPIFRRAKQRPGTYWLGKRVAELPDYIPASIRGGSHRITEIGESVLHEPAQKVTEFGTPDLKELIDDMFSTMDIAEGVGLAAPQIDVNKQIFVYDVPDDNGDRHVGYIINPVLETVDDSPLNREEGCLSVPGSSAELK
ncbi:MAG: peptide deformylase, partial [Cellulomonadaceae bacterium]|nr:peptide deformylase [Cellulomonadaceae bacterium]